MKTAVKKSQTRRGLKNIQTLLNRAVEFLATLINAYLLPVITRLIYLRVPVVIALFAGIIFCLIDQTLEIYRATAADRDIMGAAFSTFFVTILSVLIWYAARLLQLSKPQAPASEPVSGSPKVTPTKWLTWLDNFLPRLLGITPLIAIAHGIGLILEDSPDQLFLKVWLGINLGIAIIVFLTVTYRVEIFEKFLPKLAKRDRDEGLFGTNFENVFINAAFFVLGLSTLPFVHEATGSFWSLGVIVIFCLQIGLNVLLWLWGNYDKPNHPHQSTHKSLDQTSTQPNRQNLQILIATGLTTCVALLVATFFLPATFFPDLFGSVSVVAISLSIMVVIFSTIYNWGIENKVPAITLLMIAIITSSFFNWNDNHRFRQLSEPAPQLFNLEDSFQKWLASRPDRALYEQAKKPYPVYLVSAQGGGIFAAYHAAHALSKLSAYSESFPQHIFAISSVSGGSIGAATFSRLVQNTHLTTTQYPELASNILGQDLLSPLLTMGLFPDLVQRFLPLPAIEDWDRATGLEIALEKAWEQAKLSDANSSNPSKLQSQSFYQQWQPQSKTPALVINTTVVESGERLLFSPFQIYSASKAPLALANPNVNLKLSTAAGLSARFPYVTPAGWFRDGRDKKVRLVDGGYFDNSGVPTLLDIGRALQALQPKQEGAKLTQPTFKLIYLALVDRPNPDPAENPENESLNELASPLRAVFRAREARGRSAAELSTFTLNQGIENPLALNFRTLYLQKKGKLSNPGPFKGRNVSLPLGWFLSDVSKAFIEQQTPRPEECNQRQFEVEFKRRLPDPEVYNHNSCLAASIHQDLQARSTT
jgi:hypothetical protein